MDAARPRTQRTAYGVPIWPISQSDDLSRRVDEQQVSGSEHTITMPPSTDGAKGSVGVRPRSCRRTTRPDLALQEPLAFPRFVFGVDRPPAGRSTMPEIMPRYARRLRGHNLLC